jgi:hypothetical protein
MSSESKSALCLAFLVQLLSQLSVPFITCPSAHSLVASSSFELTWNDAHFFAFVELEKLSLMLLAGSAAEQFPGPLLRSRQQQWPSAQKR